MNVIENAVRSDRTFYVDSVKCRDFVFVGGAYINGVLTEGRLDDVAVAKDGDFVAYAVEKDNWILVRNKSAISTIDR